MDAPLPAAATTINNISSTTAAVKLRSIDGTFNFRSVVTLLSERSTPICLLSDNLISTAQAMLHLRMNSSASGLLTS